jgi:hypothetical protein
MDTPKKKVLIFEKSTIKKVGFARKMSQQEKFSSLHSSFIGPI